MRTSAVLAASALAIGVAACGGSSAGSGGGSATKTVTVNQSADQSGPAVSQSAASAGQSAPATGQGAGAPAATQSGPATENKSGPAGTSNVAVPDYQPASVVSMSHYSTVLTSPDSISKIGSYYESVLAKGGWQLRSSSKSAYSASFAAHRANEGVTISVYPRGSGSGVSISEHPE